MPPGPWVIQIIDYVGLPAPGHEADIAACINGFVSYYEPITPAPGRQPLETVHDPRQAIKFLTGVDAWKCYRREYGTRPDGRPNRPMTAFSVEVAPLELALKGWRP